MKKIFYLFFATALAISCNSDDDSGSQTVTAPSVTSFNNLINQAKNSRTQTQQFNLTAGGQIIYTSPKGVILTIDQSCLVLNGQEVTGNVTLKYTEVFDTADMALTSISTMGFNSLGDKALLKSGGAFNIELYKNNALIQTTCNYSLQVPVNLTGGYDTEMVLWKGEINDDGQVEWTQNEDGAIERGNNSYYAWLGDFGWVNIDRFFNDPRPKTTVMVKVPQLYSPQNSNMFFAFNDVPNSIGTMDVFTGATNSYSEHYGYVPIGIEIHLIFITEQNGSFKYGIKSGIVLANGNFEFTESELRTGSELEIKEKIGDLF